jgi:hypothetical protein
MPFRHLNSFRVPLVCGLALAAAGSALAQGSYRAAWSGYLPGNRADRVQAVAVDRQGDIWTAGASSSDAEVNAPNVPFQGAPRGKTDILLTKWRINADGSREVLYRTFIGGSEAEEVTAIAIDFAGRVHIVGSTASADFPMAGFAYQTVHGGGLDAFHTIVDPTQGGDASLILSSFYGGSGRDVAHGLFVDSNGVAHVVGSSRSPALPSVANGLQATNRGGEEAFLFVVDIRNQTPLRYSTFLGGSLTDVATSVSKNAAGVIAVAGYTASTDFPVTTDGDRIGLTGQFDGFILLLDLGRPGLDAIRYGSFVGASGSDRVRSVIADPDGGWWLMGDTTSTDLYVSGGAYQATLGGNTDVFLMRFDPARPAGQKILYSTYAGGWGFEIPYSAAPIGPGRFAIAGYSMFGGLPTAGFPEQPLPRSDFADGFLLVVDTRLSGIPALQFGSYHGGRLEDVGASVAVRPNGQVVFGGYSASDDFPVTDRSTRGSQPGQPAGVLTLFAPRP